MCNNETSYYNSLFYSITLKLCKVRYGISTLKFYNVIKQGGFPNKKITRPSFRQHGSVGITFTT